MKSQEAARVLVVDQDRVLGAMFVTVLAMEGYWAEWRPYHSDVAARARELSADLLVIGLPPVGSAYSLLDSLRSDEQARAVPVLAVTTVEQVAEGANASFNVKSTLVMPFDLEDFLSQVRRALRQPAFQKQQPGGYRPAGILDLAQQILSTRSRDTLFRWVQRLRTETALSERDNLRFSEVLDDVPILIEVLTAAFDYASPRKGFRGEPSGGGTGVYPRDDAARTGRPARAADPRVRAAPRGDLADVLARASREARERRHRSPELVRRRHARPDHPADDSHLPRGPGPGFRGVDEGPLVSHSAPPDGGGR